MKPAQLFDRRRLAGGGTPGDDQTAPGADLDVETFRGIMRRLGIPPNRVKTGLAMGSERLGRLKSNGRLVRYSPLSRFTELEILTMVIEGKKQLWTTLRDLAGLGRRLPDVDFQSLIERAEHQRTTLEPFRVRAGMDAFGTGSPDSSDLAQR